MKQKLTDAQRALVEKHMPLIVWYLNKKIAYIRRSEYDDLYQQGALGLCKAAANFDAAQGTAFTTYALYYIAGDVRRYIRREHKRREALVTQSLEDVVPGTDGITLADQLPAAETGESTARLLVLREALLNLSDTDRSVMSLHLRGYGQKDIARRAGVSQPSVCRRIQHARSLIGACVR